jgi:hypothetical protein
MDIAAQDVEAHLGDASRNCNSRLLERKARNLRTFNDMMDKRGTYLKLRRAAKWGCVWSGCADERAWAQTARNTPLPHSCRYCKRVRPLYRGFYIGIKERRVCSQPRSL